MNDHWEDGEKQKERTNNKTRLARGEAPIFPLTPWEEFSNIISVMTKMTKNMKRHHHHPAHEVIVNLIYR